MQEFQKYYDAMSEMNIETQRFLVSLMTAFFYTNVSIDEEVAEFCETHTVLDIKTYNGNNSWEKEVVIQYK